MIDPRFYEAGWAPSAAELAEAVEGQVVRGDAQQRVRTVAAFADAHDCALTFLESAALDGTAAPSEGVCIAAPGAAGGLPAAVTVVETRHPRAAFAAVASRIVVLREWVHGAPPIDPEAHIGADAVLEPGCVVAAGVAIGANTRIGANAVIGPGVQLGRNVRIGAGAVLRCAMVGDGVTILSGAVIGEAGFGLAADSTGARLSPHFGRVVIQDRASIGANSCVDRGLFADTVIGEGVHVDNLCHIGHNSLIGSHVVMAAFAGVSGSAEIGEGVQFGGRVGVKDHVRIGRGARIAAGSAVLKDVEAGETVAGYPAKNARTWMRELAWLAAATQKRSKEE